jgi:hypothetical protein
VCVVCVVCARVWCGWRGRAAVQDGIPLQVACGFAANPDYKGKASEAHLHLFSVVRNPICFAGPASLARQRCDAQR